ncbi:hypothetical protein H072_8209 [Dactylellina haptotyla CBS 200.50]|uniref:DUF202 domain-containing protein n=1 Tax=Dactylellina haptotyla (strain CBS 200.50) TaxID=1284197 RepID=S8A4X2_DACHA|nr:hypothetical protein H072_8209 [Dactylellina haptotyla CBS 200.50]
MNALLNSYGTFSHRTKYVLVEELPEDSNLFLARPLFGPLVFENNASDARDHCANERNFLSWLRLSSYLAVVSVAIMTTFHFSSEPTELEKRIAFPLGLLFWLLAMLSLICGTGNYLKTVMKYSRKVALVQTGWRTQALGSVVAGTVICCCILFLVNNA